MRQTLTFSSFRCYWMCYNICFCFFSWYFYRNYQFCVGLKSCAITTAIRKYKSIIKTKEEAWHLLLLAKIKLNNTDVLIFRTLIHSCVSHDEFVSVNNLEIVLKEYDGIKEKNKNFKDFNSLSKILLIHV